MFNRLELLIGKDNINKIKSKAVLIVGLGGVGGYVLEGLIRNGVKKILICDNDTIDISNLNRQIISNNDNIGLKKVEEAKKRGVSINPDIRIEILDFFLNEDNIDNLNSYKIDYIIDACDTVNTKVALAQYAIKNNIKIISCTGTGNRVDATKVICTTLDKTFNDPLAKVLRKRFKEKQITLKIPVVISTELPLKKSFPIASCAHVPATAGMFLVSYVINDIIKTTK